jgi:8-oxo-dGTP diphosphatase
MSGAPQPRGFVRAAGGLILRGVGPGVDRVGVIHRPRYDDWSFPKGKANEGETDEGTALREVEEETGLRCELGALLPEVRYTDALGRPKVVRYWTMTMLGGAFAPNEEVDEIRWVSFDGAEEILTYEHDRRLLRSLRDLLPSGEPAYIVRHAKAGDRTTWTEDDRLRPLTKKGRRQAEQLVVAFRGREVGLVVSSPYVRCVQTVRPLALDRGLTLVTDEALAEGAPLSQVLELLDRAAGTAAVFCSHGDVIPMLVEHLKHEGVELAPGGDWKKGSIWTLERAADGAVVRGRYEMPSSAD